MNILNLLSTIVDTLPFPAFYKDSDLRYYGCNNIFAVEILGASKAQIIGKNVEDFNSKIPHDLLERYKHQDERLMEAHGKQIYDSDVLCSDGKRRRFRFVKSAVVDENGNIEGIFGLMIDLDRTSKSSKILSDKGHYEKLGKHAAYLVHEINGPLMRMKALLRKKELLANAFENKELIDLTNELLATHETLTNISGWVRNIGHDSFHGSMKEVDLADIIDLTQELVTDSLMSNGVEFIFPRETVYEGLKLKCQAVQVSQVLYNIMKNSSEAVKDLEEKWVSLDITWTEAKIDFAVSDSGDGIPLAVQEKIKRGGQSTKKLGKGMGVGLQIVKEILKQHNGELMISQEGISTITTRFNR